MGQEHSRSTFWGHCLIWKFWNGGSSQIMGGSAVNVNCFFYSGYSCNNLSI